MRYAIIIVLLLATCHLAHSARPFQPEIINPLTESWRWRHFPELEGKGVSSIVEDKNGVVWFGVNDGVVEYNGYEWKWHQQKDGLPASPVEQLYAAKNGNIYANTAVGLYAWNGSRWENIFSVQGIQISYRQIRELSNGNLMLCSHLGLFEIKPDGSLQVVTSPQNRDALAPYLPQATWLLLPEDLLGGENFLDISDILEVSPNRVWLSITLSSFSRVIAFDLSQLSDRQFNRYEFILPAKSLPNFGESQKFLRAQNGKIWIINTSTHVGIHQYQEGRWEYTELSDMFGGDEYATDILESSDGTIWIGMLGKLFTFKNGKWEQYKSPEFKIPASRLLLTASRLRHIWIGGYRSKIFRLDYSSSRWESYRNLNFQCDTRSGQQYFLDVNGRVIHRNRDNWVAYGPEDGLMNAPVKVLVSSQGTVWAAGSHNGVAATSYLKEGIWVTETHPYLSWGIDYRAVFEAVDGSIWFGGSVDFFREKGQSGGVLQLKQPGTEQQEWVYHPYNQNGLTQSNAYGVAQSPDGRIWIGGGNLFFYDGERWDRPKQNYLRQYINIVSSSSDLLVAGSRFYGIFIYDGTEWKKFDTESGLSSNTIISLFVDSPTSIWAATENDISHFDGQRWITHVFPADMTMNHEGGHLTRSRDGAIWINKSSREWKRRAFTYNKISAEMSEGFVAYRYLPDDNHPETAIDMFSEEIAAQGNMLVRWSGEDYFGDTPDDRLLFSYRLNGGDWSPYTAETHHSFMDLESGQYTLEVRARDLDFNVDPTPEAIRFLVHPPVWQQSWFICLMLVFLVTIGIFEYRVLTKKHKLEKLNHSLNQMNAALQEKNSQVLAQQQQILLQKKALEQSNQDLENQNEEIQFQRDQLKDMVLQVEALSRSKINFFTNISHELRTPLTLILGPVEQLRRSGTGIGAATHQRLLDIIERNASRLLILINQLLEMRRIEENTLALNPSKGNLAGFLSDITHLFDELARQQHIHLAMDNRCHNALAVFDADKVEKIVANLLSNAFKHTPEGGKIVVGLQETCLPQSEEKAYAITVTDTGKGISPRKLERIFERYYSPEQQEHSSGIGLSYIKDLVSLHKGSIEVWSEEGSGTTFRITLPALVAPAESSAENTSDPHLSGWDARQLSLPLHKKTIGHATSDDDHTPRLLIVEDNPDMLAFLTEMLEGRYRILKAINGREGLQIARNHPVDLIISDVMMPEMDGLEFCNRIKSDINSSHIPVVLLTARGLEEHQIDGYEHGADDYIVKPFNPELLEIRIENLLNQRKQLWDKFNREFALTPKAVKLTSPDEELLNRIVEIMEEHIMDAEFNVNKMCEMVNLSHMHFIRKVKQLTGKKPIELLKTYRLKRAKDLLQQNKANISEVAYMVGYDLPNSFSRAFKKIYGLSPSEYVESMEKGKQPIGVVMPEPDR